MFADGELYALVVAQNISEIAPVASSDIPAMFEATANFQHHAYVVLFGCEGHFIGSQSLLPGGQKTIAYAIPWLARHPQVEGLEPIVLNVDTPILVVEWRAIQRVAHYFSPMLPPGVNVVIVKIVDARDMVTHVLRVVVIHGTTLKLGVQIFKHHAAHQVVVFQIEFHA